MDIQKLGGLIQSLKVGVNWEERKQAFKDADESFEELKKGLNIDNLLSLR